MSTEIGYKGKVSIQIEKNGRVIKNLKVHNEGCELLFKFLSESLAGNYSYAETLRPRFIHLFHGGKKGDESYLFTKRDLTSENKRTFSPTMYSTTNYSLYTDETEDNAAKAQTTYKFSIPFINIDIRSKGDSSGDINVFALYGSKNRTTYPDPLAYLKLTDENGKWSSLIDFDVDDSAEYNIIILWTLSIENK